MPGRSNKELEKEHKQIEHRPEDLKDTDVEETSKATKRQEVMQSDTKDGKQVSGQAMNTAPNTKAKPSNADLEKEHKKIEHRPEDLKDTDVEDEFKENGGKFRKNTDKARL